MDLFEHFDAQGGKNKVILFQCLGTFLQWNTLLLIFSRAKLLWALNRGLKSLKIIYLVNCATAIVWRAQYNPAFSYKCAFKRR